MTVPRLSGHRGNVKVLPRPTSPFNKGGLRGIWILLSYNEFSYQGVEKRFRGSKYKTKIAEKSQFTSSK